MTVDFAELDVDVVLSAIANIESEETYGDMTWERIPMRDGVFDRNSILGAFGARR